MYYINKIVGGLVSPSGIAVGLVILGALFALIGRRRLAKTAVVSVLVWLWLWATPAMTALVGGLLEREFLVDGTVPRIETLPRADAIVLLGGGMGADTNLSAYAEMWSSADRVWHAARLWKAGKASTVMPTGSKEELSSVPLLVDFGVPRTNIVVEGEARNTEENAKRIVRMFADRGSRPKVLLVTSAWHMKRAKLMYEMYAPEMEIIAAPTDFEATYRSQMARTPAALLPTSEAFALNEVYFHEWLGLFGYRFLR